MEAAAGIGTVVPFERNAPEREEYDKALQLWFQTRDTAAALSREEIGAMGWKQRMDAQRKAIILALAHYYRQHERADVGPGVAVVLTLLSDNEKGAATISQPTLAKLFNRSLSSIGEAQKRLKEDGIIKTSRGRYAATYPVIPRAVTTSYNHMTWLISAICENDEKPLNLPGGPVDCQSTGETGGLKIAADQSLGGSGGLKPVNQPDEGVSINRADRCLLLSKTSKEEGGAREGPIGKAVAAIAATFAAALPAAAAQHHPVEHVMQDVAECWQSQKHRMAAGMDRHEARAQREVWITPTRLVEVAGAFRAELVEGFPGIELQSALAVASPHVAQAHSALDAMAKIRRQFGYLSRDAARDAAAAKARQAQQAGTKSTVLHRDDIPKSLPMPREEVE